MAANLDKSENSLTSVSTLTYLRGIDASGNSVKISTSDLASVLGVAFMNKDGNGVSNDFNDFGTGVFIIAKDNTVLHAPGPLGEYRGWLVSFKAVDYNAYRWQMYTDTQGHKTWERMTTYNGEWSAWLERSFDIPDFYKSYANLSSLASALGVYKRVRVGTETITINDAGGCLIYVFVTGARSGCLYYIDHWTTAITKIAGNYSKIEDYVTMSKEANSGNITLTNTSSECHYTLIN